MEYSYVKGPATPPLLELTIGQAFDRAVERWGRREALVSCHEGIRWTWRELQERVDAFACGLLGLGLHAGDRIGIWATNKADWTVVQFACAKVGTILVNINPSYRVHELEYVLKKVGVKALVTGTSFKSSDYIGMLRSLFPELSQNGGDELHLKRVPSLRYLIRLDGPPTPRMLSMDEIVRRGASLPHEMIERAAVPQKVFDPINIQFTSGTTGQPKGATLTHYNVLNNARIIADRLGYSERDRICVTVPLYHCFGMVAGNLTAITHGATLIYPSEVFDPVATLEAVEHETCTSMYGVPTMFLSILDHERFAEFDVSSLRTGIMAGAPCPMELMRRAVEDMHLPEVTIAYGMTETSPVSFQGHVDDPLERRVGTVGQVCPHTEVKVVDADGVTVPCDEQGEILTRGYLVMDGYWDDKEKTWETIDADGWIHTGDLGVMDSDGWLRITGRLKDMVIRGGENIYPREIEEFLYGHEKIAEVQVFGVPDERFGEELAAWIRLHDGCTMGEEEVRDFCLDEIAYYKIPHYIRFVDSFPMTVTGKVQKFEMRRIMAEEVRNSIGAD